MGTNFWKMKNLVFAFWILIGFVFCKNSQDIDSQKDKNLFDLSKYRSYLDTNTYFEPYGRIHKDSSFSILYYRNLDSLSKLKALETLKPIFQDSSDYYEKDIPVSGSFSFYLNSLVFESNDYCGITIDRAGAGCWTSYYKTFFLVYKKGKLIAISEIAATSDSWTGSSYFKTQSKLINDNAFLEETVKLRNSKDSEFNGDFTHIDTVAKLVTLGFNGKLETTTIFEGSKPFNHHFHELKSRNPLTGQTVIQRLFFFKDK